MNMARRGSAPGSRLVLGAAWLFALLSFAGCQRPARVWSIGIYQGGTPFDLAPAAGNPVLAAGDLEGLDARFVADPFLLRRGDTLFLFFEAWRAGTAQGDVVWAESRDSRAWRIGGVALDEPFHLSYPFVFEHQGEVYLVPESRSRREVRLYVARPFPVRFELRAVLLSGQRYADSSLVPWKGRFYLFTSPSNDRLELFSANALEGPYQPHPANPIVSSDPCAARPAGRPFDWGGRLIRFAQCDVPVYGAAVRGFEVTDLSPTRYAERPVGPGPLLAGSGTGWNAGGMHHLDLLPGADGLLAVVDGWRPARGEKR